MRISKLLCGVALGAVLAGGMMAPAVAQDATEATPGAQSQIPA